MLNELGLLGALLGKKGKKQALSLSSLLKIGGLVGKALPKKKKKDNPLAIGGLLGRVIS